MRPLRIVALVHETLVPPESMDGYSDKEIDEWKTEFDVVTTLREMGHEVHPLGLSNDLMPIRQSIEDFKPHIAFNLLEEFHGVVTYDQAIVSYLELMQLPYSGCNPRGLLLSRDKALSKKIFAYHRIPSPRFATFPLGRVVKRPKKLEFPIFVKSAIEDASVGISQASVVHNDRELLDRVAFVHEHTRGDALAEQYIEGRELYVGIMGNKRIRTLPIWELKFTKRDTPLIATRRVKWDRKYQDKLGVVTELADDIPPTTAKEIDKICRRVYRSLGMSGYARMDLRMRPDGRVYVLEANANPNLSYGEDFSESAEKVGIDYPQLLGKLVGLGMRYRAPWKSTV